eukprot:3205464-Pleurochrysis_carterae.AAC.1
MHCLASHCLHYLHKALHPCLHANLLASVVVERAFASFRHLCIGARQLARRRPQPRCATPAARALKVQGLGHRH